MHGCYQNAKREIKNRQVLSYFVFLFRKNCQGCVICLLDLNLGCHKIAQKYYPTRQNVLSDLNWKLTFFWN